MQKTIWVGAAIATVAIAASIVVADANSGLAPGDHVGTFSATKCAGVDDGIAVGKSLCYT